MEQIQEVKEKDLKVGDCFFLNSYRFRFRVIKRGMFGIYYINELSDNPHVTFSHRRSGKVKKILR